MTECKCCECKYFELEISRGCELIYYLLFCSKFRSFMGFTEDSSNIQYVIGCDKFEKEELESRINRIKQKVM